MSAPDYALEEAALRAGARVIAGVDEVGRGPLAGPGGSGPLPAIPGPPW